MAVRVITSKLYVSRILRAGIEVLRENELELLQLHGVDLLWSFVELGCLGGFGLLRTGVRLRSPPKHPLRRCVNEGTLSKWDEILQIAQTIVFFEDEDLPI